jgi:uncharacterized protein YceH (UPF0502 family)
MSEVYQHQSATLAGVGWPDQAQTRTYTQRDVNVDHTARILDLEKQVAELRAALNKEPTP